MDKLDEIRALFADLSPSDKNSLLDELYLCTEELELTGNTVSHCPHCACEKMSKYGFSKGVQRYKCSGCGRTFTETTGTVLHGHRDKEKFLKFACHMLEEDYTPLRKMAGKFQIHLETAFEWRHKVLVSIPELDERFEKETELDDLWFRYSQKGRKGLEFSKVRGGSKKKGDNEYSVKLVAASDGDKSQFKVTRIGRISAADLQRTVGDKFSKTASLVSDKHPSIASFAKNNRLEHTTFKASEHTDENGKGVQLINNIAERIDTFINKRCKGVATKYIQSYANWFKYKEDAKKNRLEDFLSSALKNKNGWKVFANIEKIYKKFINNHSQRTYRCPTVDRYKANNWEQEQAMQYAFF